MKIFIIADEILFNENKKWICDTLKDEFINYNSSIITNDPYEANIIWYLSPWNYSYIPNKIPEDEWYKLLKMKKVIFTQHHIDLDYIKKNKYNKQFKFMREYGTKFHSICKITTEEMKKYFDEKLIFEKKLWINDKNFYKINDKKSLKNKYNIDKDLFLIGSFQNDKNSKCPEILVNIIRDMKSIYKKIGIILTGRNRTFIINELKKLNIKYYYFEMVDTEIINELYNCLDLYIVTSKFEGGPRAVFECGLTKTPIISTKVGIAPELMDDKSLFDINNWENYDKCKTNEELLFNNVNKLASKEYMEEFKNFLINC